MFFLIVAGILRGKQKPQVQTMNTIVKKKFLHIVHTSNLKP